MKTRIFGLFALLAALWINPAAAQNTADPVLPGYLSTSGCGGTANSTVPCFIPYNASNPLPVSGTFSASFSGFAPGAQGTPLSVSGTSATGTLPTGTVVILQNTGATNDAYCVLGSGPATTSGQDIPPKSWVAFTVGVATQFSCITSTSTTTVNTTGGSGLPTGSGGGGGGSGGGGGTSSSFGSAFPSTGTAIGVSNGTNMVALLEGTQAIANSLSVTPATSSVWTAALNATPSLANGNGIVPTQGGSVLSATNGIYTNVLQGNAALSATNGLYGNILQGNATLTGANPIFAALSIGGAVDAVGNPIFVSPGTGATWAATQSGTWNITNISGTVSLPTGASTSALQPTSEVFAGTSSTGTTGTMAFGASTTAAPTYTTGSNWPLSLTPTGYLRTTNQSIGATAASVPAQATEIGCSDGSGNLQVPSSTNPCPVTVSNVPSGSVASGAYSSGAYASGAISSGAFAAGAFSVGAAVDGSDLTQGSVADTYAGGKRTVEGYLNGIYTNSAAGTAATGAAIPASAIYIGGTDGTNLQGFSAVNNATSFSAQYGFVPFVETFSTFPALTGAKLYPPQIDTAGKTPVFQAGYGAPQTPLSASSGNVANSSAAASLGIVASNYNYVTGVEFSCSGATAASVVSPTISGTLGGTLTYTMAIPAGVSTACTPLILNFIPPLKATGTGVAITATLPAAGSGNTNATANIHGFYQAQ